MERTVPLEGFAAVRLPYAERAAWIACGADRMLGIVCEPAEGTRRSEAVLIVVGGPQYRVGSHRQFVRLARRLAAAGFVSLRFDYRGMGDSEGSARTFEEVADDLAAARDFLCREPDVSSIAVWALCDAASAVLMSCSVDDRVSRLVLVNPWARSEATLATTHLKHYYGRRLIERDFWARLFSGRFDWLASLRGLRANIRHARSGHAVTNGSAFQSRMASGWRAFRGRILLVLSGRDLTAREFLEHASSDAAWHGLLEQPNVQRVEHPRADHTFSEEDWQRWLEEQTVAWLAEFVDRPVSATSP